MACCTYSGMNCFESAAQRLDSCQTSLGRSFLTTHTRVTQIRHPPLGLFEPSYFCLIILFYYYDRLIRFYNLIIYSLIKIVLNNGNPTSLLTLALHRQQPSSALVYYRPPQVSIAFDIKIGIIRIHVAVSARQNRFFNKTENLYIAV